MKKLSFNILILLLLAYQNQQAQTYTTQAEVLSSGGGESTDGTFSNFGVVGETFVNAGSIGGTLNSLEGFIYM